MKQILQNPRDGALELVEVPAPSPASGQILVRTRFSVMSPGTDKLAMSFARKSLVGKARSRPDLVQQVVRKLRQEGPLPTYRAVTTRLDTPQPMGYSCSGTVEAVGEDVSGFAPGDAVACAGAGYASHAELVVVPANLAVRVPEGVPLDAACYATLGAIALQGVRVAEPTLGEIGAVVGLGLIGQLTVQLLRANGCRVMGIDLDPERVKQGLDQGATWCGSPDWASGFTEGATGGHGVDFAVVTASANTSAPLALAAELCRMKGRIAAVGAMPMELERRVFYDKELELRMSTSYGPGRYDWSYEESGLDYPLAYVRWTENRNLQAFLELIAGGSVRTDRLDTRTVPFDAAVDAYENLAKGEQSGLAVVFRYAEEVNAEQSLPLPTASRSTPRDAVGVAFLGAGNYAKSILLPGLPDTGIRRVALVTATGASARRTAEKFRFARCATDPAAAVDDADVDLIFVATRHDSHAELAVRCLRAGKAVWLEKPVGITPESVDQVVAAARETGNLLAIGYNRRFSPHARAIRAAFEDRQGPLVIRYTVAAGPPARGTWIADPAVGGGRIIGESCHFVDLVTYLVGEPPNRVFARNPGRNPDVDDSLVALLGFPDGSTASIEYLARTSSELPKERFEVHGEGRSASCDNYRQTRVIGGRTVRTLNQDKGQATALSEVLAAVKAGAPSPFSLEEILAVSRTTFAMLESARTGLEVPIECAG